MASFVCPPPSSSLPPTHLICLAAEGEGAQLPAVRLPPSPLPSPAILLPRRAGRPSFSLALASPARPLPCSGPPAAGPRTTPVAAHPWPGACPCPCPQAAEPPRWSSWRPGSSSSSAPAVGSPAGRVHSPFRRSLQIRRAWTELAAARGWSRLPSADGCAQAEQAAAGARSKHAWRRGRAGERAKQARRSHGASLLPLSSPAASSSAASRSERRILPGNAGARSGHRWTSARGRRRTAALGVATGGARSGDRWTSAHGGGERRRSERRPADEHTRRDSGLAAPLGPDRGFGVRCGGGGRRPQMDPGRGEKEEKEWAPPQSNPNKHPLEGIVFWGGLDASNPL